MPYLYAVHTNNVLKSSANDNDDNNNVCMQLTVKFPIFSLPFQNYIFVFSLAK